MKQKKGVVALALVAAILVLGVGYATLSGQTLYINGNLTGADTAWDVYFSAAAITSTNDVNTGEGHATIVADADAGDVVDGTTRVKAVTFSITGLEEKDDQVVFTYTVTNASADIAGTIVPTVGSTHQALSVTTDANSYNITAGGTVNIVVTAKLAATPTTAFSTDTASPETVTITLNATPTL